MLTCPACAKKTLREMSMAELLALAPWLCQPVSIYWNFVSPASVKRTLLDRQIDAVFLLCQLCYFVDVIWRPERRALHGIRRIAKRELSLLYSLPGQSDDIDQVAIQQYRRCSATFGDVWPSRWWEGRDAQKELEKRHADR